MRKKKLIIILVVAVIISVFLIFTGAEISKLKVFGAGLRKFPDLHCKIIIFFVMILPKGLIIQK